MKNEAEERDRAEYERFIISNLPLVYAAAKRFLGRGTDYEELCQAGALGLVKAYEGYDEDRAVPFTTYAFKFIEGEIRNALRTGCTVHVSRYARMTAVNIMKFIEKYEMQNEKAPCVSEIAAALGIEKTEFCAVMNALDGGVSLDSEQGGLASLFLKSHDDTECSALSRALFEKLLKALPEQEAKVIFFRYGRDMTQLEIAEKLNFSQSKVSKLEKTALLRIRAAFE